LIAPEAAGMAGEAFGAPIGIDVKALTVELELADIGVKAGASGIAAGHPCSDGVEVDGGEFGDGGEGHGVAADAAAEVDDGRGVRVFESLCESSGLVLGYEMGGSLLDAGDIGDEARVVGEFLRGFAACVDEFDRGGDQRWIPVPSQFVQGGGIADIRLGQRADEVAALGSGGAFPQLKIGGLGPHVGFIGELASCVACWHAGGDGHFVSGAAAAGLRVATTGAGRRADGTGRRSKPRAVRAGRYGRGWRLVGPRGAQVVIARRWF